MTIVVQKLAEQVKSLPQKELDEFLSWLADYELQRERLRGPGIIPCAVAVRD